MNGAASPGWQAQSRPMIKPGQRVREFPAKPRGAAMQFRYRRRVDSTIDMTPMIDTLLQLFVVFLLSMSFMSSAVQLELPKASLNQLAPDTPVVVTLNDTDKIFLNDEPIPRPDLRDRLHAVLE